MFEFFGGVSEILVPDNLKSGVTKAHRYDPDLNTTYALMAEHSPIKVDMVKSSSSYVRGKGLFSASLYQLVQDKL